MKAPSITDWVYDENGIRLGCVGFFGTHWSILYSDQPWMCMYDTKKDAINDLIDTCDLVQELVAEVKKEVS